MMIFINKSLYLSHWETKLTITHRSRSQCLATENEKILTAQNYIRKNPFSLIEKLVKDELFWECFKLLKHFTLVAFTPVTRPYHSRDNLNSKPCCFISFLDTSWQGRDLIDQIKLNQDCTGGHFIPPTTTTHENFHLLVLGPLWSDLSMGGQFLIVLNLRNPNLRSACTKERGNAH